MDTRCYDNQGPEYGDVVVYMGNDGMPYCSRVVGLPGDRVRLSNDIVAINEVSSDSLLVGDTLDEFLGTQFIYIETLPNGHAHRIYKAKHPYEGTITSTDDVLIENDCYFLLSDNRDNALDSRHRGPIQRGDILGKVLYTFWGHNASRINVRIAE